MHDSSLLLSNQKDIVHIVGIGGIGMSAIAKLLYNIGYVVQGSDLSNNDNVQILRRLGIHIFLSHAKSNIANASLVVRSTAVKDGNVEIIAAWEKGVRVASRAEILAELLRYKDNIVISGTHGKTTTTSMLGAVLDVAGYDPTVVSGGIMNLYEDNVRLGGSKWNVVEADESDGTFIAISSSVCVITNIESDHIDYYKSYNNLLRHFQLFIDRVSYCGCVILHKQAFKQLDCTDRKYLTYGVKSVGVDVNAINVKHSNRGVKFDVITSNKLFNVKIYDVEVSVFGEHNIANAIAAIATALYLRISAEQIKLGLKLYSGVKRRFSILGCFNGAEVIDDYAHHPTEIVAAIKAARSLCSCNNKVVAVIQPHRYSRVCYYFSSYIDITLSNEYCIFLPICASGENYIEGYDSNCIVENAKSKTVNDNAFIQYLSEPLQLFNTLSKLTVAGDKILFMSAGNISSYINEIIEGNY